MLSYETDLKSLHYNQKITLVLIHFLLLLFIASLLNKFDNLPIEKAQDTQDALAGYSYFSKVFDEMKTQGKSPYEAYSIAVGKSIEIGYLAHIWSRKECVDMFAETYCYDEMLKEEGREEGLEKGLEKGLGLSALIVDALKNNMSIPVIAEKYGVTVQQVKNLKEAFAI